MPRRWSMVGRKRCLSKWEKMLPDFWENFKVLERRENGSNYIYSNDKKDIKRKQEILSDKSIYLIGYRNKGNRSIIWDPLTERRIPLRANLYMFLICEEERYQYKQILGKLKLYTKYHGEGKRIPREITRGLFIARELPQLKNRFGRQIRYNLPYDNLDLWEKTDKRNFDKELVIVQDLFYYEFELNIGSGEIGNLWVEINWALGQSNSFCDLRKATLSEVYMPLIEIRHGNIYPW